MSPRGKKAAGKTSVPEEGTSELGLKTEERGLGTPAERPLQTKAWRFGSPLPTLRMRPWVWPEFGAREWLGQVG